MARRDRGRSYAGGLGFDFKWNMGWMHDTLHYFSRDPVHRALPSRRADLRAHVRVHGELPPAALARRGRARQEVAAREDARATTGRSSRTCARSTRYMWAHPGKKLLFMGGEIAPGARVERGLERSTGTCSSGRATGACSSSSATSTATTGPSRLSARARREPAGFRWIDGNDADSIVLASPALARRARPLVCVCNFSRSRGPATGSRFPQPGAWREVLNTDAAEYGGSGIGNLGRRARRRDAVARPAVLGGGDAAAAGRRVARPGGVMSILPSSRSTSLTGTGRVSGRFRERRDPGSAGDR